MSTSTLARSTGPNVRGGCALLGAVGVVGVAFAAEAVVSVVVDTHIGYHSLNAVLNIALLGASVGFALARSMPAGPWHSPGA